MQDWPEFRGEEPLTARLIEDQALTQSPDLCHHQFSPDKADGNGPGNVLGEEDKLKHLYGIQISSDHAMDRFPLHHFFASV